MCGITGIIDYGYRSNGDILDRMIKTLSHRGPNDSGSHFFRTQDNSVFLGQTRLSIIDLSPAGHQPMHFEHLSIVFNGEIYNYQEIKNELIKLGHVFVSESDTEVVLHSYFEWGVQSVNKFIGMFVYAILDKRDLTIKIVRDRAGVKPLFYYWKDSIFLFSSELKSFHEHPSFEKKIDDKSVRQFMDFGYIPAPYTIFESCCKLEPGTILEFSFIKKEIKLQKYWNVNDYYKLPNLKMPYIEAKEELKVILKSAFEYRMVSDVPVGVFLSGGYDSTAVTAILQSERKEKLKTFTIGFEDGNNEAPFAKNIADFFGTNHTEYNCSTVEAQNIIPELPYYYDEPYADSSAIPTILVSRLARKDVTVALSADAGDEIFAGYTYYKNFTENLELLYKIPDGFRGVLGMLSSFGGYIIANQKLNKKIEVFSEIFKTEKRYTPQLLNRS